MGSYDCNHAMNARHVRSCWQRPAMNTFMHISVLLAPVHVVLTTHTLDLLDMLGLPSAPALLWLVTCSCDLDSTRWPMPASGQTTLCAEVRLVGRQSLLLAIVCESHTTSYRSLQTTACRQGLQRIPVSDFRETLARDE